MEEREQEEEQTRCKNNYTHWPRELFRIMANDPTLDHLLLRESLHPCRAVNRYWPSNVHEWHTLALAIEKNSALRQLYFSNDNINITENEEDNCSNTESRDDGDSSDKSCQEIFFEGLVRNRCITKLYLNTCKLESWLIEQMKIKLQLAGKHGILEELHISDCTVDGYTEGLRELMVPGFRTISLNNIQGADDATMATTIEAIMEKKNDTLLKLDLSRNIDIGMNTITACANLISNPLSNIRCIRLNEYVFNDEKLRLIGNALSRNRHSKLECFEIIPNFTLPRPITADGWHEISRALCNPSSIEHTYDSNHKLFSLGYTKDGLELARAPPNTWKYLKWNERGIGKKMKILQLHFVNSFDVDYFCDIPSEVIPHVLAWIANDYALDVSLLTVMYNFIRKLPDIVVGGTTGR